jgi:hypothetical protein
MPLVQYDNFIWILVACHALNANRISKIVFATQEEEPLPEYEGIQTMAVQDSELLDRLQTELDNGQWIVDLDLDYFFDADGKDLIYGPDQIEEICSVIRNHLHRGHISALTIALSPSCSGEWPKAVEVCELVCETLGLNFPVNHLRERI